MSYIMRNGVPYLLIKDGKKYMEATPYQIADSNSVVAYLNSHEGKTELIENDNGEQFLRFTFEPFPTSIINELKNRDGKNNPQLKVAWKWGPGDTSWSAPTEDEPTRRIGPDLGDRIQKLRCFRIPAVHDWDENNIGYSYSDGHGIFPCAVKIIPEQLARGEILLPARDETTVLGTQTNYWSDNTWKLFIDWNPSELNNDYIMESSTILKADSETGEYYTIPNSFTVGGSRKTIHWIRIKTNELTKDNERVYVSINGAFNRENPLHEDKEELDITNSTGWISTNCYALQFRTRCGHNEKRFRIKSESMGWDFISTSSAGGGVGRSTYTTKMIPIDRDVTDIEILYL